MGARLSAPVILGAMATVLEAIDDGLAQFVRAQHMFFVSTAPTDADGLVNVSPKGMDGSFAVLGPLAVAYLDLTGSGAETIAQRRDNGRICLMLRAFDGPPGIVRLHGRGTVGEPGDDDWGDLAPRFADTRGARAIIRVDVTGVADSCGSRCPS